MIFMNLLIIATGSLFVLPATRAFYWQLSPTIPQQCTSASIVTNNHTTQSALPLRLLVIPYGPLPLSDASTRIYEIPFNGPDPYRMDFQVKYPAGTQFIELVNAILLHSIVQAISQASRFVFVRIFVSEPMYVLVISVTQLIMNTDIMYCFRFVVVISFFKLSHLSHL